jgi:hypothetical protein
VEGADGAVAEGVGAWSNVEESQPEEAWRGACGDAGVGSLGFWALACLSHASRALWSTGQTSADPDWFCEAITLTARGDETVRSWGTVMIYETWDNFELGPHMHRGSGGL